MMRVLLMQLYPAVVAVAAALAVPLHVGPAAALPAQLADSQWRLVEVQSMDSAQGTTRPSPGTTYTMELSRDGSVTMQLNCNRARGSWSAQGSAAASSGGFRFGPLAATRAFCPPPSLDAALLAQAGNIRSFLLKDGRLMLSLLADGGILVWEPAGSWQVSGQLLEAVLSAHDHICGTVFDQASVLADVSPSPQLASRLAVQAGDFFAEVPAGADAYLMKHILHDWHDDACLTILGRIRAAMAPGARLLVLEPVIAPGNEPFPGKLLDLNMLVMTDGGRERTAQEYADLLQRGGFRLERIVPTAAAISVVEAFAAD
jgi:heat shock protein HslJ